MAKRKKQDILAPNKLCLLVTVVPRKKAELILDTMQDFEANLQLEVSSFGTAESFGLLDSDREKQTIFSVIRQDAAPAALLELQRKFDRVRGCKGIAFTIPMTGTVGVSVYRFLSNRE